MKKVPQFTIDGIRHGLRGWRRVGDGKVVAETVDAPGMDWVEGGE